MTTVVVEFDGATFVPQQPVNLPVGTKVSISIPSSAAVRLENDRSANAEEWDELMRKLNQTESPFASVEEALGRSRKLPGYYP